ncbi:zinc-dependent peptidase [soil metagenome]
MFFLSWFRKRRRVKLLDEPFPSWWLPILDRNVGHYRLLSDAQKKQVRDITTILIAEKRWESSGGMVMSDEVKVTIAAQAALLLLGMEHDYYRRVHWIIVYPRHIVVPDVDYFGDEDDTFPPHVVSGLADHSGDVSLSWEEVLHEARDPEGRFNVVLHEFAHQLDFVDGVVDGTPLISDPNLADRWGRVMQAAFDRHYQKMKKHQESFFTEHASDDESEFFSDASEAFFCAPHDLSEEEPEVFELLQAYYKIDTKKWFTKGATHPHR